eukprot:118232-Pyramimonas_sp.AAC.1
MPVCSEPFSLDYELTTPWSIAFGVPTPRLSYVTFRIYLKLVCHIYAVPAHGPARPVTQPAYIPFLILPFKQVLLVDPSTVTLSTGFETATTRSARPSLPNDNRGNAEVYLHMQFHRSPMCNPTTMTSQLNALVLIKIAAVFRNLAEEYSVPDLDSGLRDCIRAHRRRLSAVVYTNKNGDSRFYPARKTFHCRGLTPQKRRAYLSSKNVTADEDSATSATVELRFLSVTGTCHS